jgi:polar amino acid transport system permease protein
MTFTDILLKILEGAGVTLGIAGYALVYAVPFAFVLGTLQYLLRGWARTAVTGVIEFWRSNAVIILLYVFYYLFPFAGLRWSAPTVSALVLGFSAGAYGSQIVRGALQSIPRGQIEAGGALGLHRMLVLRLIEYPQAIRPMIPSFVNELIRLIQSTALVSLLTLHDMTFRAKQVSQITHQPVEIYTALLLSYFVLSYPLAVLGRRLESRTAVGAHTTTRLEIAVEAPPGATRGV